METLPSSLIWPDPASLESEDALLTVRASLPRLHGGDPLQAYKWALSTRLRNIRSKRAGAVDRAAVRALFAASSACEDCEVDMWESLDCKPTLDHRVALANGGTNSISNLRVICNRCNSRKSDRA